MINQQPECPECEKLHSVHKESQKLGLFLDWVLSNYGRLCIWYPERRYDIDGNQINEDDEDTEYFHVENEGYYPNRVTIERILADYFKIDLNKVDEEREQLLRWIQENNEGEQNV